jgi:hypothetical protein
MTNLYELDLFLLAGGEDEAEARDQAVDFLLGLNAESAKTLVSAARIKPARPLYPAPGP